MSKYKHSDDSLEKWKEWQEHQYDPGYWTGGNTPPYLNEEPSKTKVFGRLYTGGARVIGWTYILTSVLLIAFMSMIILSVFFDNITISGSEYPAMTIALFILGGVGALGILVGMKYLDKAKSKRVNALILGTALLIGLVIMMWPLDTSEMIVKNASGETVVFRFQKDYFGSGNSCHILDSINKKEIARFSFPGQRSESKNDGWSLEYLIDSPELKVYSVKGGIIFKADNGSYQAVSNYVLFNTDPRDNPDLVPITKALATKEWRWMKMFGAFLLETGDQDVKDILQRYADGRFSEEEIKKNRIIIPGRPLLSQDDMQAFAKKVLENKRP